MYANKMIETKRDSAIRFLKFVILENDIYSLHFPVICEDKFVAANACLNKTYI
jgi:hypothetical protein